MHRAADAKHPESIVIVGAGAAGFAAADMLRREGYTGPVTMVSADADAPYDRPNLSKDYLAGTAREDWMPLRDADYYAAHQVTLRLNTRVNALDTAARQLTFEDGTTQHYGSLLLAVGADPVKLTVPGANSGRIHYLRSFADSRAIIKAASAAKRAVVIGASFIGLEVAASLRARGLEVHVVAPDARPMEKILGADLGDLVRTIHERHGVVFHLGETVASIDDRSVALAGGASLDADLIAVGIGVRPVVGFIEKAGIAVDRGVSVDEHLETSVPGVFAAGDIARWPDPHTGERIRVEHWVVAERQGQTAARNMLGMRERFEAVPFFWSQHYDVTINHVGHADKWDTIEVDGNIEKQNCVLTYRKEGRALAVATVGRDLASLQGEVELERWTYRP
jgi:NADPH-dependent 2,4-dienoyl-CoA reductase/sulfur reductase-like enzyme